LTFHAGRFTASATWDMGDGRKGQANAISLAAAIGDDTSQGFWFFAQDNLELEIKVLDGRDAKGGGFWWVFASGLTNAGVVLTVIDTKHGITKTYRNPIGTPFQPIQDTSAFPA
jgi:hypothetical protein